MYLHKPSIRFQQFRCLNIILLILLVVILLYNITISYQKEKSFFSSSLYDDNWQFSFDEHTWIVVTLPHTPRYEPIEKLEQQWQGTCFYRKQLTIADDASHRVLRFDAAMHEADVWLNDVHTARHLGGYLPFDVEIPVSSNTTVNILIRLRNTDNAIIPPGKSLSKLDFNYYGGLYRHVWLLQKSNRFRFGEDIRIQYKNISLARATINVRLDVIHDPKELEQYQIRFLLNGTESSPSYMIFRENRSTTRTSSYNVELTVSKPRLWSPSQPNLYQLSLELVEKRNKKVVFDRHVIKIGIRSVELHPNSSHLVLNGEKFDFIVGTNRHQEYPYVGYALSDQAQYRDAYKIKLAGFHLVRCSHYPPAPSFLDACDRLGLFVINSIPGWQFFGNQTFQKNSLDDVRQMVRRDRHHPSIILWEASLNESPMTKEFIAQAHAIVKEESPDGLTGGWMDEGIYDVFTPARQHGWSPNFYRYYRAKDNKMLFLAEHGDWEYYGYDNFNQSNICGTISYKKTSRQRRRDGEKRLLQQAHNFQEAHNHNRGSAETASIMGDANWLMFDYKRGYASDIEASGVMDINRLPKFAFYFYQSQCVSCTPMIFIASYWTNSSNTSVTVYSNCEHVELQLNGIRITNVIKGQQDSSHLFRPPFVFNISHYTPGRLDATGFVSGKAVVQTHRSTPGNIRHHLKIEIDHSGQSLIRNDLVFIYVHISDANDTIIPDADDLVISTLSNGGDCASLVGANPVRAEAGIATFLLKTTEMAPKGNITIRARAPSVEHQEAQLTFSYI